MGCKMGEDKRAQRQEGNRARREGRSPGANEKQRMDQRRARDSKGLGDRRSGREDRAQPGRGAWAEGAPYEGPEKARVQLDRERLGAPGASGAVLIQRHRSDGMRAINYCDKMQSWPAHCRRGGSIPVPSPTPGPVPRPALARMPLPTSPPRAGPLPPHTLHLQSSAWQLWERNWIWGHTGSRSLGPFTPSLLAEAGR